MTINPPPPGSGLPQANGISPSVSVKSVTLEPRDPNPATNMSLVIESSVQEKVNSAETMRWYDRQRYANYLRLRVIVSFSSNASRTLDFIQQRLNEYHGGAYDVLGYESNTSFLNALKNPNFGTNLILGFDGPYDTIQLTRTIKNEDKKICYLKDIDHLADTVFKDVILYDAPVAQHLQRDENDDILRRRTASVTNGEYTLEEIPLRDVVFPLGSGNENYPSTNFSQMSIYSFTYFDNHQWERDNNLPPTPDMMNINFGFVYPTTPQGEQFIYQGSSQVDSFVTDEEFNQFTTEDGEVRQRIGENDNLQGGIDPQSISLAPNLSRIRNSPDQNIFQNLLLSTLPNINTIKKRLYENFYNYLSNSVVGKGFADTISNNNFYSPLWVTKDNGDKPPLVSFVNVLDRNTSTLGSDNARYCFAFDKRAFLVENSRFPLMYIVPEIANELFNGGEYIHTAENSPDNVDERSGVVDIRMMRRSFEFDAYAATNNLTTMFKTKLINPDYYYPEVIVSTPNRNTSLSLPDNDRNVRSIEFYEGRDVFSPSTQTMGRYQYGAHFILKDSSALYILRVAEKLRRIENQTLEIFNKIVNSVPLEDDVQPWFPHGEGNIVRPPEPLPPRRGLVVDGRGLFDYNTRTRIVALSNIGADGQTAEQVLYGVIEDYLQILVNFGVATNQGQAEIRETLRGLVNSSDPEGINELAKTINLLAFLLEGIAAEEFPGAAFDDENLQKSVIEQRGYCQRKLVLLESKHYFDSYFDYGKEYKLGYNYILQDDGGLTDGLIRVDPSDYKVRASGEFYKYFDFYRDANVSNIDRQQAPYDARFINSTLTYFSPLNIKTHGKDNVNQPDYKSDNSNYINYDLNRYGELFADIVKTKYNTDFLNKPFYQVYDTQGNEPENLKLYHSLQEDLTHHYCYVEDELTVQNNFPLPEKSYALPASTIQESPDQNTLKTKRYDRKSISALNLLVGGDINTVDTWTAEQNNYITSVTNDAQTKDDPPQLGEDSDPPEQKELPGLPIKLLFSILGELEIDSGEIGPRRNYIQSTFNSFVENARNLGLDRNNIRNAIENNFSVIPNQFKAMLAIAATNERSSFGNGFDAVRFELEDRDRLDNDGRNIGAVYSGDQWPPYQLTSDMMKIYSKFLAFWMNYKQIAVVEYLSGFGFGSYGNIFEYYSSLIAGENREDITHPKVKLPEWKKFTGSDFNSFFEQQGNKNLRLLCRIRSLSEGDYNQPVTTGKGETIKAGQGIVVDKEDLFNLPVYNRYFVLENSGRGGNQIDPIPGIFSNTNLSPITDQITNLTSFQQDFVPQLTGPLAVAAFDGPSSTTAMVSMETLDSLNQFSLASNDVSQGLTSINSVRQESLGGLTSQNNTFRGGGFGGGGFGGGGNTGGY